METTLKLLLTSTQSITQFAQSATQRLEELAKKCDLMVWKMAKLESMIEAKKSSMNDARKLPMMEDVKPNIRAKEKSYVATEKPKPRPPTPKRVYIRKSPAKSTRGKTVNIPSSLLIDVTGEDDDNDGSAKSSAMTKGSGVSENHPSKSNNTIPCISTFRIGGSLSNVDRRFLFAPPSPRPGKVPKVEDEPMNPSASSASSKESNKSPQSPLRENIIDPYPVCGHLLPVVMN